MDSPDTWRWIWAGAAVFFFLGEMLTPGAFVSLPFAIGAVAALVAALLGVPVLWEWVIFLGVSIVSLIALRPLSRRLDASTEAPPGENVGANRLLGQTGVVIIEIPGSPSEVGRVKVGTQEWRGRSATNSAIAEGEAVEVLEIEGTTLIVRQVSS